MQDDKISADPALVASSSNSLRIVYVFAGHRRRTDIREHLENLAHVIHYNLDSHEFDLLRGKEHDVLDTAFWTFLIDFVKDNPPFCIIATPPCSTYSRVRHFYQRFQDRDRLGAENFHKDSHGVRHRTNRRLKRVQR